MEVCRNTNTCCFLLIQRAANGWLEDNITPSRQTCFHRLSIYSFICVNNSLNVDNLETRLSCSLQNDKLFARVSGTGCNFCWRKCPSYNQQEKTRWSLCSEGGGEMFGWKRHQGSELMVGSMQVFGQITAAEHREWRVGFVASTLYHRGLFQSYWPCWKGALA